MACIPYAQWITANAACRDKTQAISVKGFGYAATGRAGLLGLGATFIEAQQLMAAASAPPAQNLNTQALVYDVNDPCSISVQAPCPAGTGCPAICPTGWHSIGLLTAPGQPALCNCAKDAATVATAATSSSGSAVAPSVTSTPPLVQASMTDAGFSHWGLLAALAVGGGALYLVMKKKSS